MMGLGGVITYKKANLGPMVANMSPDNLVLETDAPYLSPVPFRGKRNESRHIVTIAEKISEFRGESLEVIRKVTTDNAKKLFAIRTPDTLLEYTRFPSVRLKPLGQFLSLIHI